MICKNENYNQLNVEHDEYRCNFSKKERQYSQTLHLILKNIQTDYLFQS